MGAASCIGRIGALAVALGVGTAIVTGQGVANATPPPDGQNSQTGDQPRGDTGAVNDSAPSGLGKIEVKHSRIADVIGRHRATDTTPTSLTATSIVRRLSDAAETAAKRVADAMQNAAGAVDGDKTSSLTTTRSSGSSSLADRLAARAERIAARASSPENSPTDGASDINNVIANEFVNRAPAVKEWLASPRVAAGRAADASSPVSTRTSLWTPPRILTAPLVTMTAAPDTGLTAGRAPILLTSVLNIVSPFAGNTPTAPPVDSPAALLLLGAARREIGIESFTSQALLAPAGTLVYDPDITLVNGVISGDNNPPTTGNPLTYTVVSDPSGGGKVLINPATGDFSFLPDFSSVQNSNSEETFSVLVAETTPFDAALTQIPLVGSFVPRVLVVLYQVPIVNVVLAPLIGQSTVVPVTVEVGDLVYDGATRKPVAFTVMVESFDGTMISTNFFPATTVVGGATSAPTILNGPGLATAGNTDPDAESIVGGLVPGLKPLRDTGYNVVTWDPRGEFDSGGILQLDSPAYEGQDVQAIISWVTDNRAYTYPAFDIDDPEDANEPAFPDDPINAKDPAIGMVGGSYGGGIQLVTAGIDDRIDVIVPGIAWNSLNDSLYPRGAFKTSYSLLLLLSLVTTGSRINPQIYGGIISGAVLGILTPGQQALLAASGPDFLTGNINIPTLFIQGTVDVLFPLQQALTNAETLGPAADISMIWFCGGHGVCLTLDETQLDEQNVRLLDNTLDWLDRSLMGEDADIPKFQFVDQNGHWYTADLIPTDDGFYSGSTPITTDGGGGLLGIIPLIGGSGPESAVPLPYSLGLGSEARNAINIPLNNPPDTTTVVGAPTLKFTYSGIGTSRHVYAQIVDKKTGLVVGNIVTPIPVTLDGQTHEVDIQMEDIAYTMNENSDLALQIVGSATPYLNLTSYGVINVTDVSVSLPTPGDDANVEEETLPAVAV